MSRRDTCEQLLYFLLLTSLNAPSHILMIVEPGRHPARPVILSAAKNLLRANRRFFAALRMTGGGQMADAVLGLVLAYTQRFASKFQAVRICAASSSPSDWMACWRRTN